MEAIEIRVDGGMFDDDLIARMAHRYTADWSVRFTREGDTVCVHMAPLRSDVDASGLAERVSNDLLDERLRRQVRAETHDIHTALLQAALRQAAPVEAASAPL